MKKKKRPECIRQLLINLPVGLPPKELRVCRVLPRFTSPGVRSYLGLLRQLGLALERIWRRKWQPTPVLSPEKSHGWRSVVGYSPQGGKESDTTERLHFHLERIGLPRWN